MYCTVTALFPLMIWALCLHMSLQRRGPSARLDLSCCQPCRCWCQVSGQKWAPHAALRYGHHSQSCHHPHATVTKDTADSCRGQQHPATVTFKGQNCPATDCQQNNFPTLGSFSICDAVTFLSTWLITLKYSIIIIIMDVIQQSEASAVVQWTEFEAHWGSPQGLAAEDDILSSWWIHCSFNSTLRKEQRNCTHDTEIKSNQGEFTKVILSSKSVFRWTD